MGKGTRVEEEEDSSNNEDGPVEFGEKTQPKKKKTRRRDNKKVKTGSIRDERKLLQKKKKRTTGEKLSVAAARSPHHDDDDDAEFLFARRRPPRDSSSRVDGDEPEHPAESAAPPPMTSPPASSIYETETAEEDSPALMAGSSSSSEANQNNQQASRNNNSSAQMRQSQPGAFRQPGIGRRASESSHSSGGDYVEEVGFVFEESDAAADAFRDEGDDERLEATEVLQPPAPPRVVLSATLLDDGDNNNERDDDAVNMTIAWKQRRRLRQIVIAVLGALAIVLAVVVTVVLLVGGGGGEGGPAATSAPTAAPASVSDPFASSGATSPPTVQPTRQPTSRPTRSPTVQPTATPTLRPTRQPTQSPTVAQQVVAFYANATADLWQAELENYNHLSFFAFQWGYNLSDCTSALVSPTIQVTCGGAGADALFVLFGLGSVTTMICTRPALNQWVCGAEDTNRPDFHFAALAVCASSNAASPPADTTFSAVVQKASGANCPATFDMGRNVFFGQITTGVSLANLCFLDGGALVMQSVPYDQGDICKQGSVVETDRTLNRPSACGQLGECAASVSSAFPSTPPPCEASTESVELEYTTNTCARQRSSPPTAAWNFSLNLLFDLMWQTFYVPDYDVKVGCALAGDTMCLAF